MAKIIENDTVDDIQEYRNTIKKYMAKSTDLLEIFTELNDIEPQTNNFFPQQYIPNIVDTEDAFIFFDIETTNDIRKDTYTDVTLYFWVISHKKINLTDTGLLTDKIVWEIKKIFKNKDNLGIGVNHEVYNRIFNTGSENYIGRILGFKITDWSDVVKKNAKS